MEENKGHCLKYLPEIHICEIYKSMDGQDTTMGGKQCSAEVYSPVLKSINWYRLANLCLGKTHFNNAPFQGTGRDSSISHRTLLGAIKWSLCGKSDKKVAGPANSGSS